MLVWFDHEESGLLGSRAFVTDYLLKKVLNKFRSKFIGAYITDMVMTNESKNMTQMIPEFIPKVSGLSEFELSALYTRLSR